jgi:glycine/D-amino acid oxidase-like deaminating enzyme
MTENAAWMVRYSVDLYDTLEQETGLSTGFKKCGYLQLATTERREEGFRRETAFLRAYGLDKQHDQQPLKLAFPRSALTSATSACSRSSSRG